MQFWKRRNLVACYIVQMLGPVSFKVKLTDGQIVHQHQDHIRQIPDESVIPVESEDDDMFISSGVTLPTTVLDRYSDLYQ